MLRLLLVSVLSLSCMPAFAIYKCASGSTVNYSDVPCPNGSELNINNAPLGDEAAARRKAAEDEKKLKRLEADQRKRQDREDRMRQRAAKSNAALQRKCATLARRQKWAEEDARLAAGKASAKARRKAQRAAETYHSECGEQHSHAMSLAG